MFLSAALLLLLTLCGILIYLQQKRRKTGHNGDRNRRYIELLEQKFIDNKTRLCLLRCHDTACFVIIGDGHSKVIHADSLAALLSQGRLGKEDSEGSPVDSISYAESGTGSGSSPHLRIPPRIF